MNKRVVITKKCLSDVNGIFQRSKRDLIKKTTENDEQQEAMHVKIHRLFNIYFQLNKITDI